MQAQIEDFISKQGQQPTPTPAPAPPAPAQGAITNETPVQPKTEDSEQPQLATPTPTPTSILPTNTDVVPVTPAPEAPNGVEENVSIAHKKIIQPPVEPIETRPDLTELLAREGISSLDDAHQSDEVVTPGGSTPHQPGHVISPSNGNNTVAPTNALNTDDPNNIAL
jgi:hypothetical protein